MTYACLFRVTAALCCATVALTAMSDPARADVAQAPTDAVIRPCTPAQRKIGWAEAAILKEPGHYRSYNDLASALVRRARETSNPALYAEANRAVATSLLLAPNNFGARRIEAELLVARAEFAAAAKAARALQGRAGDDISVYGLIADAAMGLGDYAQAEEAVQWMLNLRAPAPPALVRAARLRELFGDPEGAVDLLNAALAQIPPDEIEERALTLTHLGRLKRLAGNSDDAAVLLAAAVELFPDYAVTLQELGCVRSAQGRHDEAIGLIQKACELSSDAGRFYALGRAFDQAGRAEDVRRAFDQFVDAARPLIERSENANCALIEFYADRADRPAEALRIAELQIARQHDVATLEAYAWALHVSGNQDKAQAELDKVFAVGAVGAKTLYRAGVVAAARGDNDSATAFLTRALKQHPDSAVVEAVQRALAHLATVTDAVHTRAEKPAAR